MVRPPVYAFGENQRSWGFVYLKDLSSCLGISPFEVWQKFFGLAEDYGLLGVANATDSNWVKISFDGLIAGPREKYFGGSYTAYLELITSGEFLVNAGWAMEVLNLYKKGVTLISVTRADIVYDEPEDFPRGVLRYDVSATTPYAIIGFGQDGKPFNFHR